MAATNVCSKQNTVPKAQEAEYFEGWSPPDSLKSLPALGSLASAKSCAIPQLSSGHTVGPSCSQRGLSEDLGRNEGPPRSTVEPHVLAI